MCNELAVLPGGQRRNDSVAPFAGQSDNATKRTLSFNDPFGRMNPRAGTGNFGPLFDGCKFFFGEWPGSHTASTFGMHIVR